MKKVQIRDALKSWLPVVFWMIFIFTMSHQTAEVSSQGSDAIADGLLKFLPKIAGIPVDVLRDCLTTVVRKGAHFTEYAILGMLLLRAMRTHLEKAVSASLALAAIYAASDEFHQLFINGRSGEVRDVLLDIAGTAVGIWIANRLYKRRAAAAAAARDQSKSQCSNSSGDENA